MSPPPMMKIRSNIWILDISIFVCIFLSVSFGLSLYVVTVDSSNISDNYARNWDSNYIVDIVTTTDSSCTPDYQLHSLGMWSGFSEDSCLCVDKNTNIQLAGENKKQCEEYQENFNNLSCVNMPSIDISPLTFLKNFHFCVKRADDNFHSIWNRLEEQLDIINYSFKDNFLEYHQMLKSNQSHLNIHPNAVIDIKLLNTTLISLENLKKRYIDENKNNLFTIEKISENFYLMLIRLGNNYSISDVDNLIIDLRVYNRLMCAYDDINSHIELGYREYRACRSSLSDDQNHENIEHNEHNDRKNSLLTNFVSDDLLKTESVLLNFDNSVTLYDLYDHNGINEYYSNLNLNFNFNLNRNFINDKPILVYEKYLSGMGCIFIKSTDEHIKRMRTGKILENLSKIFVLFSYLVFILSCVFVCLRLNNNCIKYPKLFYVNLFLILFITILNMILSFSYGLIVRGMRFYLKDFSFFCLSDFTNQEFEMNKNNIKLVSKYYDSLYYPYELGGFLAFVEFCNTVFLILYILFSTCCKINEENSVNESRVQNIEVAEINNIKDATNFQNNDFHELDKTDNRSKI